MGWSSLSSKEQVFQQTKGGKRCFLAIHTYEGISQYPVYRMAVIALKVSEYLPALQAFFPVWPTLTQSCWSSAWASQPYFTRELNSSWCSVFSIITIAVTVENVCPCNVISYASVTLEYSPQINKKNMCDPAGEGLDRRYNYTPFWALLQTRCCRCHKQGHLFLNPAFSWLIALVHMGLYGSIRVFSVLGMARVAIKTVSILCPDVNPDCEASRKLALVCCWHFLITVFLIILPRNEMGIADIYMDNVFFLRSGKTTYFSKSLIGESLWLRQWLFPSLAGKLLHCY